jgi:MFS superfamily sulfate permease-like transporter
MLGLVNLQHKLHPSTTVEKLEFLVRYAVTDAHKATTIISFTALAALVIIRSLKAKFKRYWFIYRLPEVLIVLAVSIVLSEKLNWSEKGVDILGSVQVHTTGTFMKFPLRPAGLKFLRQTTSTAALISVVGFLDSIVAAKQNGSRFGHSISPNRELVALGASNLVASFVPGTLPAYGSITRSRINGDVGGRTQMASLVCSAIVLSVTYLFLPFLYYLPKCVLAPVICLVAVSLLAETPHDVIYYWRMGAWVDLTMLALTFVLSLVWNLEAGIAVSVIISLLLVVHRSSKTKMSILGRIPGTERWKPISEDSDAQEDEPGALIVRIHENLDFANTAQLKERLRRLELYGMKRSHPSEEPRREQASVLVFHLADVEYCDAR